MIFVDTWAWVGLALKRDQHHRGVKAQHKALRRAGPLCHLRAAVVQGHNVALDRSDITFDSDGARVLIRNSKT